jgi:hypothetical protein
VADEWKEVVTIALRGGRFDEKPALRISDLDELEAYQRIIIEAARALFFAENPERERVPKGFEDALQLRFTTIRPGSTAVPLEARQVTPDQQRLWDLDPDYVEKAIAATWAGYRSLESRQRLPAELPPSVVALMDQLGATLRSTERLEIRPIKIPSAAPAVVNAEVRAAVATQAPGRYEDEIRLEGEVRAADIDNGRFLVHPTAGPRVEARFSPADEDKVTQALHEHQYRRVVVRGRALFEADGVPVRLTGVDSIEFADEFTADQIGGTWAKIASAARDNSISGMPHDLSARLDDYLYGERD